MRQGSQSKSKNALVLAGGGLSGAVYELGALRAIDDLLVDMSVNDFDVYVGTSAGSIVASGLVNGLTPSEMLQSMEGSHPILPAIHRKHLFRFNTRATVRRMAGFPNILVNTIEHYRRNPNDFNLYDLSWELSNTLPSALYDGMALEGYLHRMLAVAGITNNFADLHKELYIIGTSLENGQRVVFGDEKNKDVPISLAVAASSAVPVLYKPVRIGDDEYLDGGLRGNASLDIAIERGAKLIVCVNPMVPLDNSINPWEDKLDYLSDQGMQVVIDQVFRILLHSGLHYHIKQLRRRHPDVDIILIEPKPNELKIMFSNVMRYSTRLAIARHGYDSVTVDLEEDYNYFKSILARHGVQINRSKVVGPKIEAIRKANNSDESVEDALDVTAPPDRKGAMGTLRSMLDDIESVLGL